MHGALRINVLIALFLSLLLSIANAADLEANPIAKQVKRPNILWITSEDNASHWLGCYGNKNAKTPRLDALAKQSVLFEHAYSNAPVCAVARSTIMHGNKSPTSCTQHMRSRHAVPPAFKPYVSYLCDLGYYCSNNSKTDFNRLGDDREIWDACSNKAHYKNRKAGQPFFAIFNLFVTHESNLFPEKVANNRSRGIIPATTRLSPQHVQLPPSLPDLPAVRNDIAIYHDCMTALDRQVGRLLDELEEQGLADDTIVFYFADHGGATPRGKRYLRDTGVRVPMIVHVPKKWRHLSPFQPGERTDELVSFVDLAPTLLSLCSQPKPEQMQGRAFLGAKRVEPAKDPVVFLYADRFDERYGMRRGIADGRFKYIRRFTSHLPAAPHSLYSLGQPAWASWQQAWKDKSLSKRHRRIWESPQPVEELYDVEADPWEVDNLSGKLVHQEQLNKMRSRLQAEMLAVRDTGVIPEPMFRALRGEGTISEFARSDKFDYERALQAAFIASSGDIANLSELAMMLADENPVVRYWGALGCAILGKSAQGLSSQLLALGEDEHACIRMTAAHALFLLGQTQAAKESLIHEFDEQLEYESVMLLMNLVPQLGCTDQVPPEWIKGILGDETMSIYFRKYVKRLAQQLDE